MKVKITHVDKEGYVQPLIRDTFFCERENGCIDFFGTPVVVQQCWITSWMCILGIPSLTMADVKNAVENSAVIPFKQAIQRTNENHIEEYHGCKIEIVPDDFDWQEWIVWNVPLEWNVI